MDFPATPCRAAGVCGFSRGFPRLSPGDRQVPYVLLTRAPVAVGSIAAPTLPLDLHVLGLSLAFILSQDQTLRCCYALFCFFLSLSDPRRFCAAAASRPVVFAPSSFGLFPYIKESTWTRRRPCPLAQLSGRPPRYALVSVISSRSIISMDSSSPFPVGRDCKGNNFFPFHQITAAGFSAPGTAVPRLRLQRYYQIPQPTKFFRNFFQRFSCMIRQLPTIQTHNSLIPSTPTIIHANCYCMQKGRNTSIQHASPLFIHIK